MLEMVDRRGDYEDRLWQFVGTTIKETVLKYQIEREEDAVTTEVKQFTADELGNLLVTAVKDKEVSKVGCCTNGVGPYSPAMAVPVYYQF